METKDLGDREFSWIASQPQNDIRKFKTLSIGNDNIDTSNSIIYYI